MMIITTSTIITMMTTTTTITPAMIPAFNNADVVGADVGNIGAVVLKEE